MIKWIKPDGGKVESNERKETVAYLESINWKREGEETTEQPTEQPGAEPEKAKRTRRTRAQMAEARETGEI